MKFGLDVATDGEYADPHKLVDLAVAAEEAGWNGFFIWDVLFAHEARDESISPHIPVWVAGGWPRRNLTSRSM